MTTKKTASMLVTAASTISTCLEVDSSWMAWGYAAVILRNDTLVAVILGTMAAAFVFFSGFGALALFWHLGSYGVGSNLPGLYDYRAATWGDGLFLPVGAFGLSAWLFRHRADCAFTRKALATIALAFASVGIVIQAQWLISDSTALNWTIPQLHHFNAPGWYHAAFFVAAFSFFGTAFTAFGRMHFARAGGLSAADRIFEFTVWFAASGYFAMHLCDDHPDIMETQLGMLLPLAVISAVALVVCHIWQRDLTGRDYTIVDCACASHGSGELAQKRVDRPDIAVIAASQACALGVCSCIISGYPDNSAAWVFACALTLISVAPLDVDGNPLAWRFMLVLSSGAGAALCLMQLGSLRGVEDHLLPASAAPVVIALVLSFALYCAAVLFQDSTSVRRKNRALRGVLLYLFALLFGAYFVFWPENTGDTGTLIYSFALMVAAFYSSLFLKPIQQAEEEALSGDAKRERSAVTKQAYGTLAMVIVGMLGLFLFQISSQYPFDLSPAGALGALLVGFGAVGTPLAVFAALLAAIAALGVVGRKSSIASIAGTIQLLASLAAYIVLVVMIVAVKWPVPLGSIAVVCLVLAVFLSCGTAVFVAEAYVSNVTTVHKRSNSRRVVREALVVALGCAATCFVSVVPSVEAGSTVSRTVFGAGPGLLGLTLGLIVVPGVLSAASVWRVAYRPKRGWIVTNTPTGGIVQNGFSAFAITALFGIFAYELMVCMSFVSGLLTFLAALVTAYCVMKFPLESNRKFLARSICAADEGRATDGDPVAVLRVLSRHFQRQSLLAAAAMFPWSLLYWVSAVIRSDKPYEDRLRQTLLLRWRPLRTVGALVSELVPGRDVDDERLKEVADEVLNEQRELLGDARFAKTVNESVEDS